MSSASDVSRLISSLINSSIQINRYLGMFIILFGVVGNIANLCILSRQPLRSNPCAWLFLVSSIANSIGLLAGLISRVLSTWSADLTNTNQFLCKFRAFLLFDGITIAVWLITLATFDRWLSSNINANRRQQSTLKNAQRGAIIIVIISTIIEAQQIYCFEANLTDTPIKCYTRTVLCGIISDLTLVFFTILVPLTFMFIFGLMTIINVRKVQSRLQPITMTYNGRDGNDSAIVNIPNSIERRKKADRHLLIMLFIQVLLILLFTLPLSIYKLYSTLTREVPKTRLENIIESFIFNLFLLLYYVSCGMPFYIYILTGGKVFREALYNLLKTLRNKIMCR